jgi:hypothetical protein
MRKDPNLGFPNATYPSRSGTGTLVGRHHFPGNETAGSLSPPSSGHWLACTPQMGGRGVVREHGIVRDYNIARSEL